MSKITINSAESDWEERYLLFLRRLDLGPCVKLAIKSTQRLLLAEDAITFRMAPELACRCEG